MFIVFGVGAVIIIGALLIILGDDSLGLPGFIGRNKRKNISSGKEHEGETGLLLLFFLVAWSMLYPTFASGQPDTDTSHLNIFPVLSGMISGCFVFYFNWYKHAFDDIDERITYFCSSYVSQLPKRSGIDESNA